MHTGDALNEADGFFGRTVHYAARVAASAGGGEILVSSVVHDLVADAGIEFLEPREVVLKGIDGPSVCIPSDSWRTTGHVRLRHGDRGDARARLHAGRPGSER